MALTLCARSAAIAPSATLTITARANQLRAEGIPVIGFGVGEPDFDTPWHVREERIYSLEKGRTFYTSNAGLMELKEEISNYLDRRCHVHYNPKNEIIVTVGGSEGIDIAMRAMLDPGDEVLIPQPSYVSYEPCCVLANGTPVIIELKAENEFRLTAEELKSLLGGAKMREETIAAVAKGKDMSDGMPLFFEVTAQEINFAIRDCVDEICKAITDVLEVTPPELVRDITDDGIFLCGGMAKLYGFDKYIEEATGIKVKIPGNATNVAALGCLRALNEENYLSSNGYHFVTLETLNV